MSIKVILLALSTIILSSPLLANASEGHNHDEPQAAPSKPAALEKKAKSHDAVGLYEDYSEKKLSLAVNHKVVLFFKASWCGECRELDADITKNLTKIPPEVAILKVDYDNSAKLKRKYGVTRQLSFVQVDKNGAAIKKWTDSISLADVVSKVSAK